MNIATSAPGKLFLLGEYAVLDGAPALLTAVNRRARVSLHSASDAGWTLSAPQLHLDNLALTADGRVPTSVADDIAAVLNVYAAVRDLAAPDLPAMHIHIDTADFFRDGNKLGLGSSAAVTAALCAAFAQAAGESLDRATLCQRAMTAHRCAQNGVGSGADVATATYGQIIVFRPGHRPRPLRWPAGMHALAIMTGEGASTRSLVGQVRRLQQTNPSAYARHMQQIKRLADAGHDAMAQDKPDSFLQIADNYHSALVALGDTAGAGIVLPVHHKLHATVAAAGGVFKTTGAGGGDIALAFCTSPAALDSIERAVTQQGYRSLPLTFGADGVRSDTIDAC